MTVKQPSFYVRFPSRTVLLQLAWHESDNCELVEMDHGYFILKYASYAEYLTYKNTVLIPALPEGFSLSQLVESFDLREIKEVRYVIAFETAKDIITNRSNGGVKPIDKATGLPTISPRKGGRFWLDGEFTLEELEALVIIGKHQLTEAA